MAARKSGIKIGDIFGKWKVLEEPVYAYAEGLPTVLVECLGCNKPYTRILYQIARNNSKSVGCAACLTTLKRKSAVVNGIKTCSKCKIPKPENEFHNDKHRFDGKYPWCALCTNAYTKPIKKRHRDNRDGPFMRTSRKSRDRRYFGSDTIFGELILLQGNKCATCDKEHNDRNVPRFAIDHCHATKMIRGILCDSCNKALGHARDNPEILRRLAAYLESNAQILITGGEYSIDGNKQAEKNS